MATLRPDEVTRSRSRSDSFSDTPVNPPNGGQTEAERAARVNSERLDRLEGQLRRMANSMEILGRQLETFAGEQPDRRERPAGTPFETPDVRQVNTSQPLQLPHPSPGGDPFAPELPAGFPAGYTNPGLVTDPWSQWLSRQGVAPPPGFGRTAIEDTSFDRPDSTEEENPFKRSEKWMPSLPKPNFSSWKSRPTEVVGFVDYVGELASWTGLGSNSFPREIMSSLREGRPISYERLSAGQITRSIRLFSILKLVFEQHPRAHLILRNYEEGLGRVKVSGYEGLRLLAREFGIKSRTELMYFRQQITNGNFYSSGSTIPEIVRKVQFELLRFEKVSTLVDPAVNLAGCEILEADKIFTLLKSLPHACKTWLVLNVITESFEMFCEGALKYESQQRVWAELSSKPVAAWKEDSEQAHAFEKGKGKGSKGKGKGKKDGKGKDSGKSSDKRDGKGNEEKRTCFKCGNKGHLQANCPNNDSKDSGKGKNKGKSKTKGKPKGSRAAELTEDEPERAPSEWSEIDENESVRLSPCIFQIFEESRDVSMMFAAAAMDVDHPVFWLVDTGASRSVISESALGSYHISKDRSLNPPLLFRTASGQEVSTDREVIVEVWFKTHDVDDGSERLMKFELRAVVGPVEHNLLSVCQMTRAGHSFFASASECCIYVGETKQLSCEMWSGVPWLHAKIKGSKSPTKSSLKKSNIHDMEVDSIVSTDSSPSRTSQLKALRFLTPLSDDDDGGDFPLPDAGGELGDDEVGDGSALSSDLPKLQKRVETELALHRRRGHIPFDSRCSHCVCSRSVMRHERQIDERKSMGGSSYLIQADFFFVGLKNQKLKFVACAEAMTGMVGASFCGPDVDATLRQLSCFFRDLGLNENSTPVETLTDAEPAISSLLSKLPFKLLLKKSAPQEHRTIGRAERTVRRFKEMISCIRSDLRSQGFDIVEDSKSFVPLMNYIVQTHNHFGVGSIDHDGARRSPHELALQKDLPRPEISLFGSIVHAVVTDAIRDMVQPGLRFVVAAYLYPDFGGLGHVVSTLNLRNEVFQFVTKVKPLTQLCWDQRFCMEVLSKIDARDKIADIPAAPGTEEVVDLSEQLRHNGPPKPWVDEYGPTSECTACNSVNRRGKNHSVACKRRYTEWLKQQRSEMREPIAQPDSAHGQQQFQGDGSLESKKPDVPLVLPDPQSHPTGGRRTVGKQPPTLVVEEVDDDDMEVVEDPHEDPHSENEPAIAPGPHFGDVEMGGPSDAEMFDVWKMLSPSPEEDWMQEQEPGVMYPFYIPVKGESFKSTAYELCNHKIFMIRPTKTLSEDFGESFEVADAERGRVTELDAMNRTNFGTILTEEQAKLLAAERGEKIIPCRWVVTSKEVDNQKICRARCVAQQIAKADGASAMSLGISSSTPSLEALRVVLSCIGAFDLCAETLDISTAFLHSPLPQGVTALVRLPADLSLDEKVYKPVFADLSVAMNGLRSASKAWLQLCTALCKDVGVISCPSEPTVLCGITKRSRSGTVVLVYVDDLIVGSEFPGGLVEIREALGSRVKVKVTGEMSNSSGSGGTLLFLGKTIQRPELSNELMMRVDPSYLKSALEEWGDLKATRVPPDILHDLERSAKDPSAASELSPEASTRYRRVLGRVMWWGQSRPDFARHLSLLASGMAKPTNLHEAALRKVLKYIKGVCHLWNIFPVDYRHCYDFDGILGVADASWGPSDFESRRSATGGAIYWKGCLVKAISRLQAAISLSSCESETIGICQVMQETVGIRTLIDFVGSFKDEDRLRSMTLHGASLSELSFDRGDVFHPIKMMTDSESCLGVLRNEGFSRRVRHLCISICFIQRLVNQGRVALSWIPTLESVADIMTKILSKELTERHRVSLGICELSGPEPWQIEVKSQKSKTAKKNEPNTKVSEVLEEFAVKPSPRSVFKSLLSDIEDDPTCNVVLVDICTSGRAGFA